MTLCTRVRPFGRRMVVSRRLFDMCVEQEPPVDKSDMCWPKWRTMPLLGTSP